MKAPGWWMTPAAIATVLLSAAGGCSVSTSAPAAPAAHANRCLLASEPAEPHSVIEVRQALAAADAPAEVVVIGCVGGLSQATWDPERAAFMMVDLSLAEPGIAGSAEHEPAPSHDADNCPFCRAKKKQELAGMALVQVLDADDRVPAVDARRLLGLSEGDTVVVTGQAHIDKLGALVVRSRGIYVRPRAKE